MKMFQRYTPELRKHLGEQAYNIIASDAQFIDVSDVAQWFYNDPLHDGYDFGKELCSILPFDVAWLEYRQPQTMTIGRETRQLHPTDAGLGYAAFMVKLELKDDERALDEDAMQTLYRYNNPDIEFTADMERERRAAIAEIRRAELFPRWLQRTLIYVEAPGKRIAPCAEYYHYVADNGLLCGNTTMCCLPVDANFDTPMTTFLLSISFLHCKNVKLEDVAVPPKVQAKREKQGTSKITFKTLVVEPLRQQVRREAAKDLTGEQNHIKRALHIARGHFKDYRDGPGLFGKYQGLYWWDMQVRGNADAGVVVKDYNIKR